MTDGSDDGPRGAARPRGAAGQWRSVFIASGLLFSGTATVCAVAVVLIASRVTARITALRLAHQDIVRSLLQHQLEGWVRHERRLVREHLCGDASLSSERRLARFLSMREQMHWESFEVLSREPVGGRVMVSTVRSPGETDQRLFEGLSHMDAGVALTVGQRSMLFFWCDVHVRDAGVERVVVGYGMRGRWPPDSGLAGVTIKWWDGQTPLGDEWVSFASFPVDFDPSGTRELVARLPVTGGGSNLYGGVFWPCFLVLFTMFALFLWYFWRLRI